MNFVYSESDVNKIENISKISALIEEGRFYYPNIDKKDLYGNEKSSAYQGYKHITLEILVYIFKRVKKG